jgi:hypothetical protein
MFENGATEYQRQAEMAGGEVLAILAAVDVIAQDGKTHNIVGNTFEQNIAAQSQKIKQIRKVCARQQRDTRNTLQLMRDTHAVAIMNVGERQAVVNSALEVPLCFTPGLSERMAFLSESLGVDVGKSTTKMQTASVEQHQLFNLDGWYLHVKTKQHYNEKDAAGEELKPQYAEGCIVTYPVTYLEEDTIVRVTIRNIALVDEIEEDLESELELVIKYADGRVYERAKLNHECKEVMCELEAGMTIELDDTDTQICVLRIVLTDTSAVHA